MQKSASDFDWRCFFPDKTMKKTTALTLAIALGLAGWIAWPHQVAQIKTAPVAVTPVVAPVATKVLKRRATAEKPNPTQDALDQFGLKLANSFGVSAQQQSQPQP